jgi:hypothetical protein
MPPGVFCAGGVPGQDACSGEELSFYSILSMLFFEFLYALCLLYFIPKSTYINRALSSVFRIFDPLPLLPLASVAFPRTKGGGLHTRRVVRGWGINIFNISEDARHWIGLLQYNPSTLHTDR